MNAPDPTTALALADHLRTAQAVRQHSQAMLQLAQRGQARHFEFHPTRLAPTAAFVADVIRQRYPAGTIPYHSRWRHFEPGGVDRWAQVATALGLCREGQRLERARARIDLAVTSVLLDAGAGPQWHYLDEATGQTLARSEGLGVASLRWWAAGGLSSNPKAPWQADAEGLQRVSDVALAQAFQVGEANPLVGVAGRVQLLRQLGRVMQAQPAWFSRPDAPGLLRPGHLLDWLFSHHPTGEVPAGALLSLLLRALGGIWPSRHVMAGQPLGDCWPHPDAPLGWLPFHKLSQWMAYSLLEPLEDAGLRVVALDELTGLPEYRNGGLLLDMGVLTPRDAAFFTHTWRPSDEPIVEWRALTVALLDLIAQGVRDELCMTLPDMPLARVLEGGTWAAGRAIARERRPDGGPPVRLDSDGTVF